MSLGRMSRANLRFELGIGVKGSVAEAELVLVMLRMLNSLRSCKKTDGFPMSLQKQNAHKLTVKAEVLHTAGMQEIELELRLL